MSRTVSNFKNSTKRPRLVDQSKSLINLIKSKQTEELIIAFCGALGSGTSVVAKHFVENLKNKGYRPEYIKVSERIRELCSEDDRLLKYDSLSKPQRTKLLQDLGDELRDKYGTDILAQKIIRDAALQRKIEDKEKVSTLKEGEEKRSRRYAIIIDSLKHPDEFTLLKAIYGNMLYMVGVLCPETIRVDRLETDSSFTKQEAVELTQRDKDEGISHGQKLLKTLQKADFFIRNVGDNIESLDKPTDRYLSLMLGKASITPTIHEYAMHAAHSAALRSGCMSRQVGAAILNSDNDLISTGRNDVPKGGGGLYGPEEKTDDCRCIMTPHGKCQSNEHKSEIIEEIHKIFSIELSNIEELSKIEPERTKKLISGINAKVEEMPQLQGLIEFSRAVHAEMDAITTAARNTSSGLKGGSLYCTTFPCHHCARHIVASGIKKIYYIEPYEKSLAFQLHKDSIEIDAADNSETKTKLKIIPFEGVAPKKYPELFTMKKRKENGKRKQFNVHSAKPLIEKFLYNSIEFESVVATYFEENIGKEK